MANTLVIPFNYQPFEENIISEGGNYVVPADSYVFLDVALEGTSSVSIDGTIVAQTNSNVPSVIQLTQTILRGNSYAIVDGTFTGQMTLKSAANPTAGYEVTINTLPFLRNASTDDTKLYFARPVPLTLRTGHSITLENVGTDIGNAIYLTGVVKNDAADRSNVMSYQTVVEGGRTISLAGAFARANIRRYKNI